MEAKTLALVRPRISDYREVVLSSARTMDYYEELGVSKFAATPEILQAVDPRQAWHFLSDRGWGLFIWQDANRSTDTIFVAWFTFTPDGKPAWYSFQPAWANTYTTADSPLLQSARPPGGASPPLGVNTNTAVGVASLDFTTSGEGDEGTLTYTFGTGAKQVRTIKRFKP